MGFFENFWDFEIFRDLRFFEILYFLIFLGFFKIYDLRFFRFLVFLGDPWSAREIAFTKFLMGYIFSQFGPKTTIDDPWLVL